MEEKQNKTIIYLSFQEAELFKWFRQYQDVLERAFKECKPGSLTLHFDNQGNFRKEELHFYRNINK
jgi:23S rRNA G2069 N7-methylase RlmK/C1962 C5-methylase RlmI